MMLLMLIAAADHDDDDDDDDDEVYRSLRGDNVPALSSSCWLLKPSLPTNSPPTVPLHPFSQCEPNSNTTVISSVLQL
jgi:hypothetical protein